MPSAQEFIEVRGAAEHNLKRIDAKIPKQRLVVFTGPDAYVSTTWFPSKLEHGLVVPTWTFTLVPARGALRAVDVAPWLLALLVRLTEPQAAALARPWSVNDAPEDFVQQTLRAIVGIEIELVSLVGKWKVSQNRSAADRRGVAEGVCAVDPASAALVPR